MKNKIYHTVGTKSNNIFLEIEKIDTHSTQIHDRSLVWLGTGLVTIHIAHKYMTAHFYVLIPLTHKYMTAHFYVLIPLTHKYMTAHLYGWVQAW